MATDFFSTPIPFLNIPMYWLIIPIGIGIIIYLLVTRKPRPSEYKPIDMKKEIKKSVKDNYNKFGIGINKTLYRDIIKVGYCFGYMPMMWNKKIKIKDNLTIANIKEVSDALVQIRDEQPEIQEVMSESEIIKANPFSKKKEHIVSEIVEMYVFKFCNDNIISISLARILGIGLNFMIVEKDYTTVTDDSIIIKVTAQPTKFYGIYIFSKTARHYIENISFRTNRENELQEIANTVPRAVFFDTQLAKWVARARENAQIEKEKYKGQIEAGEEA